MCYVNKQEQNKAMPLSEREKIDCKEYKRKKSTKVKLIIYLVIFEKLKLDTFKPRCFLSFFDELLSNFFKDFYRSFSRRVRFITQTSKDSFSLLSFLHKWLVLWQIRYKKDQYFFGIAFKGLLCLSSRVSSLLKWGKLI